MNEFYVRFILDAVVSGSVGISVLGYEVSFVSAK